MTLITSPDHGAAARVGAAEHAAELAWVRAQLDSPTELEPGLAASWSLALLDFGDWGSTPIAQVTLSQIPVEGVDPLDEVVDMVAIAVPTLGGIYPDQDLFPVGANSAAAAALLRSERARQWNLFATGLRILQAIDADIEHEKLTGSTAPRHSLPTLAGMLDLAVDDTDVQKALTQALAVDLAVGKTVHAPSAACQVRMRFAAVSDRSLPDIVEHVPLVEIGVAADGGAVWFTTLLLTYRGLTDIPTTQLTPFGDLATWARLWLDTHRSDHDDVVEMALAASQVGGIADAHAHGFAVDPAYADEVGYEITLTPTVTTRPRPLGF